MKVLRFLLLWLTVTVVMSVSWSIGSLIGNALTGTRPPDATNAAEAGKWFAIVCAVSAFVFSLVFWKTSYLKGRAKMMLLMLFVFCVQSLLPQMETWLFASSIGISGLQIVAILIAGAVMTVSTAGVGIVLGQAMNKRPDRTQLAIQVQDPRRAVVPVAVICVVVYPVLYFVFGYYIAWQNETLRIFYSGSAGIKPFFVNFVESFGDGIYIFQILRALIWFVVAVPVVSMFRYRANQYVLIAALFALPAVQLFIPNPYMPAEIARVHFWETATSNVIWGIVCVYTANMLTRR